MEYHFTDQLGQAVTGARKAALEAADQLSALDQELAAERESHRAETLRLVERAEGAEGARYLLEARLATAEERAAGWDAAAALAQERTAELEDALEEATTQRDTAEEKVSDLEDVVERLEAAVTLKADDLERFRTYVSMPGLTNREGLIEWAEALATDLEAVRAELARR